MSTDVVPMPPTVIGRQGSWKQGELFELLSLMTIGCLWLIGTQFGVFDYVAFFAIQHNLLNLVMSYMGFSVTA